MIPRPALLAALVFAGLIAAGCGLRVKTGVWVVRDQITSPEGVAKVCMETRAGEVDSVLIQVRGRGDAFYRSDLAPRSEQLKKAPPDFDPLATALNGCVGRDIIAWINAFYVWGAENPPESPDHVVLSHPEWLLTDAEGRPVTSYTKEEKALGWLEGAYADPGSEGYRYHLAEIAAEIVTRYKVAGVHLDFIRYPGPDYGRTGPVAESYKARYGLDPRYLPTGFSTIDPTALLADDTSPATRYLTTATLLWAEERASAVDKTVEAVAKAVKGVNPQVRLSAAVFPDAAAAYLEKGQDWRYWSRAGLVDDVFPMSYFGGVERVSGQLAVIAGEPAPQGVEARLWAGLGAYIKTPAQIEEEATAARRLGVHGVCLFDLGSLRSKGGLTSYLKKVRGAVTPLPRPQIGAAPLPEKGLLRAYRRFIGPDRSVDAATVEILAKREKEFTTGFAQASRNAARAVEVGGTGPLAWRQARGIFRYVHPLDSAAKKAEQLGACAGALEKLKAGEDISLLAPTLSQDASKAYGGKLARIYRDAGHPEEVKLFSAPVGGLTEIVEVPNGCWVYKVDAEGSLQPEELPSAPWAARREAFHAMLAAELARGG